MHDHLGNEIPDYPIAHSYAIPKSRRTSAPWYWWTCVVPVCPHCGETHHHSLQRNATPWLNPLTRSAGAAVADCRQGLYEMILDIHPPAAVLDDLPEDLRQVAILGFPANARAVAYTDGEDI